MKNLVIVESPTKAKTLARFLGKDFEVTSSKGHIRDLPKSELGVDTSQNFKVKYVSVKGKDVVIKELRKALKGADKVWLATDLDREGEAIAWHLAHILGIPVKDTSRVVFHEITKAAVEAAFANPGKLDLNLVDAQQARRVLDRLVGYKLSPLLWKKVRTGLSAGRVQSVAVRFVVEREKEREAFSTENYWSIQASLGLPDGGGDFQVAVREVAGKPIEMTEKRKLFAGAYQVKKTLLDSEAAAEEMMAQLRKEDFVVSKVEEKEVARKPYPPFTTASLQSSAAGLGFAPARTMRLAQKLYEEGYITYHRTDSRFISESAIEECRGFIKRSIGEQYLPSSAISYRTKSKTAQEAHEAIRPTKFSVQPREVRKLGSGEAKLYELIWRATVACQMKPAVFSRVTIDVSAGTVSLRGVGQTLKFAGWLKVRPRVGKRYKESEFPPLQEGQNLNLLQLEATAHQTSLPPRYSEAALVRTLKKNDIGRPSTYASIISTIAKRGYVVKDGGSFVPTDVGVVVTDLLVEHFPQIVDISFTAGMETDLDMVADGDKEWVDVVREFWEPFSALLKSKEKELKREEFTVLEETSEQCPECGKKLVIKLGKYGKFISCSGFPDCKYARPHADMDKDGVPDEVDKAQLAEKCPECGGELMVKEGRFGKFIACSHYPKCKFTKNYLDKIGMGCPECGEGEVIVKRTRRGKTFFGCSRYPQCKYASWKNPLEKTAEDSSD